MEGAPGTQHSYDLREGIRHSIDNRGGWHTHGIDIIARTGIDTASIIEGNGTCTASISLQGGKEHSIDIAHGKGTRHHIDIIGSGGFSIVFFE